MGEISFTGDPPFALRVVQSAEAKALDATVEMTLRVILQDERPDIPLDERPDPTPVQVHVHLPLAVAQHLADQLQEAVRIAEREARRKGHPLW